MLIPLLRSLLLGALTGWVAGGIMYDGGRGFVGAITGVGNLDNRGGYYEDLVDSDGNVKKGTWRRGGDAYGEYGRSVSLWR